MHPGCQHDVGISTLKPISVDRELIMSLGEKQVVGWLWEEAEL